LKQIVQQIPNGITLVNLLSGSFSIILASGGYIELAVLFIFIAALMDFLDGFAARLLKAYSPIGAQLDSLADMISFGLAPAFLVFRFVLSLYFEGQQTNEFLPLSWIWTPLLVFPLLISVFAALRLAKFNIDPSQSEHFLGLPTPAMALFFASLVYGVFNKHLIAFNDLLANILLWDALVIIFSVLMIAELRMLSLKFQSFKWKSNQFRYLFVGISLILLVSLQTISIPVIILWYILCSLFYHIFLTLKSRSL
jgi:CDP-diacylglycerol--serine O-phosphatidyltransferase